MKKILFLCLALALSIMAVQAQNKANNRQKPTTTVDGKTNHNNSTMQVSLQPIQLSDNYVGLEAPLVQALKDRQTIRQFRTDELPVNILSSLLWSAYGFNRPKEHKRVAPSAVNVQEFDIYLFTHEGVFLYDAENLVLNPVVQGDYRANISSQPHFAVAPVSVVMVANYDRMKKFKAEADRDFYAAVDCGYISQNIYLYCASANLGTVACGGIDRDFIHKILKIKNGRALLAHPVGIIAQ